jgi:hypothetical protein
MCDEDPETSVDRTIGLERSVDLARAWDTGDSEDFEKGSATSRINSTNSATVRRTSSTEVRLLRASRTAASSFGTPTQRFAFGGIYFGSDQDS